MCYFFQCCFEERGLILALEKYCHSVVSSCTAGNHGMRTDWNQAQNWCSLYQGISPLNNDISWKWLCFTVVCERYCSCCLLNVMSHSNVGLLLFSVCLCPTPNSQVGVLWVWGWVYKHFMLLKRIKNTKFWQCYWKTTFKMCLFSYLMHLTRPRDHSLLTLKLCFFARLYIIPNHFFNVWLSF